MFEETIKTLQQKEPPRELFKASTQTFGRTNFLGNLGLNIENQTSKVIGTIGDTRPTSATSVTWQASVTKIIGVIEPIRITGTFSIMEELSHQLLENKHTLMLGQLFKIASDLKQYVTTKFFPRRKNIIVVGPNPIITLVAIDPNMDVIQV